MKPTLLFFSSLLILVALSLQSCGSGDTTVGPQETATENTANQVVEAPQEAPAQSVVNSLESDIEFIRDKYSVITQATPIRRDSFAMECDGGTNMIIREYDEQNELAYLLYESCSEHGCTIAHHYFWGKELIFLFKQNTFWVGNMDQIKESRTYFKDRQMIRCLEKEATTTEGYDALEKALRNAPNTEVDCTSDRITANLQRLRNLPEGKAQIYLCQ